MTTQEIDNMMAEIDATVDTSNFGIVDGIGVVEKVSEKDGMVTVESLTGTFVVKAEEIKPYDGM